MQNTEQTSIDIEFTECLNTSFAKSSMGEKMKGGGASAQQHQKTESGNLSCNHSKSQEKKTEEDANNNNEENLRRWKTKLDAACHGERLSPGSGESLDGCQFRWTDGWMEESVLVFSSIMCLLLSFFWAGVNKAMRPGGCESVTERIIPIAHDHNHKGNEPVTEKSKVMLPTTHPKKAPAFKFITIIVILTTIKSGNMSNQLI